MDERKYENRLRNLGYTDEMLVALINQYDLDVYIPIEDIFKEEYDAKPPYGFPTKIKNIMMKFIKYADQLLNAFERLFF